MMWALLLTLLMALIAPGARAQGVEPSVEPSVEPLVEGVSEAASDPAAQAPVELVVRVDDRTPRFLVSPELIIVSPDGQKTTVTPTDDMSDPLDRFKGDRLYLARVSLPAPGRVWVMLMDRRSNGKIVTVTRAPVTVGPKGGQTVIHVPKERDQIKETTEADLSAAPEAASQSGAPNGRGLTEKSAFPLAAAATVQPQEIEFQGWASNAVRAAFALIVGLSLLTVLSAGALRRLAQGMIAVVMDRPAPPDAGDRVPRWVDGVALGSVGLLLAVVWGPSLPRLAHDFLGVEYVDHYGTQWFYWFVEYNLKNGLSADNTNMFFFPWGKDVYKHTGSNVLDAYLSIPFRSLFGPVLGYNVFVLFGYALSGFAFYRLARELSTDRVVCVVSAAFFTLQPYLLLELLEGRPTQAIALFPVLFFWALIRSGLRRGLVAPILGGIMLALSGYQYWFYALFGGIAALIHGIWRTIFPAPESGGRAATFARHGVMGLIAIGLALPVALPMVLMTTSGENVPGLLDTDLWSWAASPPITREGNRIGIFSWQPLRAAMGFLVIDNDGDERFLSQYIAIPWVSLLLLLLWFRRPGRLDRGTVIAMLVGLTIFSMGPVLLIGTSALPNIPYIYLVKSVSFLRRLWWPSRCLLFVILLISLVMVQALAWLRRQPPRVQAAGFAGLALWWAWDLADTGTLPFPTWDATIPAGYQSHLYFQTDHEHPLLGGMLEDNTTFTPPEFTEFRTSNPMVSRLLWGDPIGNPFDWDSRAEDEVFELGYRYLVVQKDAFYHPADEDGPNRLQLLLGSLHNVFGDPVYDDGRIAIYAPWGDDPPCDPSTIAKDPAPVGPTEAKQEVREREPEDQLFTRILTSSGS